VRIHFIYPTTPATLKSSNRLNSSTSARRITRYAVTRALEIISESLRRLPDDVKAPYSGLDWHAIAAAGNVYRHEYDTVDDALIWHMVKHGLDELDAAVRAELKRLGELGK